MNPILRHACRQCSGSCQGTRVRLLPAEHAPIAARAAALQIPDPIDDQGRLRQVGGACAFLDGANCRLHATYGADAKPQICQQYPRIGLQVGASLRTGIDPGCLEGIHTWRSAPALAPPVLVATHAEDSPAREALEADLCAPQALPALLDRLCGPGAAGFGARLLARVRAAELAPLLARPDVGDRVRAAFAPVLAATLALQEPPALVVQGEAVAWGLEAMRRVIHLRLLPLPPVPAALLVLSGVILSTWADPAPARAGPAISAWTRLLRAPPWLRALAPDPATLAHMAHGSAR